MNTLYRPVPGYDDLYAGMDASIVLAGVGELKQKPHPSKGYLYTYIPGIGTKEVHPLIAAAFLGQRPMGMQVRHSDSNKLNNSIGNYSYGTPRDNTRDAIEYGHHGAATNAAKTECPQDHEYTNDNTYIHPVTGHRQCNTCRKQHFQNTEDKQRLVSKSYGELLTTEEKKEIAYDLLLRKPKFSDRAIARKSGLTHTTVARYRRNTTPNKEG